jgi:hypothetical protein
MLPIARYRRMPPPRGVLKYQEDPIFPTPMPLSRSPCAYPAVAAQVPGEVADVSHVLGELLSVPAGCQLRLALQRPELCPQRPLPPREGEKLRPGPQPAAAAASTGPGCPRARPLGLWSAAPQLGPVPAASTAALAQGAAPAIVSPAGRTKGAALDVSLQFPQRDRVAAAPCAVITLDAQLAEEAAQRQHAVQLARHQLLAPERAVAPPRRPGQQAAGTEDVPAGRAQGFLQHLATQLALQSPVHRLGKALQGKAHVRGGEKGEPKGKSVLSKPLPPRWFLLRHWSHCWLGYTEGRRPVGGGGAL